MISITSKPVWLYTVAIIVFLQVIHVFSHIRQTYLVGGAKVDEADLNLDTENIDQSKYRWVTKQQFAEAAISTAMRKVSIWIYVNLIFI